MKDTEKKNIIFFSDEFTPYSKEFTLLSDSEIADLVERRLFSNNYFNYTIFSIHKSKGTIVLIRDACGHKVETTLSKIEGGLVPETCDECRQAEKDKLIAFKSEIQDEIKVRGLVVVLFETEENTDSLYIECTKCGAKYYLNDDFSLDDEAWEMYCKNWDCMMDALALEGHWFAEGISNGNIVIKENTYKSSHYSFVEDYEDWYESLTASDGYYESKCEQCNVLNILPLGNFDCKVCDYFGIGNAAFEDDAEKWRIEQWDAIENQAIIRCEKCKTTQRLSCDVVKNGSIRCPECYQAYLNQESERKKLEADIIREWRELLEHHKLEKKITNTIYSMKIEELDLSVRSYCCLKRAGIDTVEQLIERKYEEVADIRNLGKKSFEEIINKLAMLGIYLE